MKTILKTFRTDTLELALSLISVYQKEYKVSRFLIDYDPSLKIPYFISIYFSKI